MKTILAFLLSLTIVLITISCSSEKQMENDEEGHEEHGAEGVVVLNEKQRAALNLQLGTFQMRNLTTVVKVNGQLEVPPGSSADVTAIIGGNVKSIKVFHGDKVRKGQTLAILEHPDYISLQEDFAAAANNFDFLEKEYERQKELFENNIGAGKDYQKVKSEFRTAKARYEGLKSRLILLNLSPEKVKNGIISNTINILSPINGYVNEININIGTYADAKENLFAITDNNDIHADFMVYEKDVHLLKMGQKVDFTVSNRPSEELTATVFAIGKEFESNTRSVHIHAKLNNNTGNLVSGMYISGHIHTNENYIRSLPNDAVVTEGTKSFIFVLNNKATEGNVLEEHEESENHDGHELSGQNKDSHLWSFRMVEVITGQKDDGFTEIRLLDSLPANSQVVLNVAYYLLSDMNKEETEHDH